MNTRLAIDIGASNGRLVLGCLDDGRLITEEIYRFKNTVSRTDGHQCWDIDALYRNILKGLKRCAELGKIPASLGVDTWGVDFVLLDAADQMLGGAVTHRDARTYGIEDAVSKRIPDAELYARTGIQKRRFNTIYQIAAVQSQTPGLLKRAEKLMMIPDYLHFLLTGVQMSEYTNASTTGLLNVREKTWDIGLLDHLGFPRRLFGELHAPGTTVGRLSAEVQKEVGFDCDVVMPPTHDTASAFLAVPTACEDTVFLSCGTWNVIGVETGRPITTEASRAANFSNEGGFGYRYRFLKNILGLSLLERVRLDVQVNYPGMAKIARTSSFSGSIDASADGFLNPSVSLAATIRNACAEAGLPVPEAKNDFLRCLYNSLARVFAKSADTLETLTGRKYSRIHIVGPGSRDTFLNELTAHAAGLPVYAGPADVTVLGSIAAQMIAAGELDSVEAARTAIRAGAEIKEYEP